MKIRPGPRSVISRSVTHNSNGTTKISRRNSGDNSPPPLRTASTSACNRCWIGLRLTFGATSSAKTFQSRRCILPKMASAIARSDAVQLPNQSRATPIPLTPSLLNWKPRARASAPAAPRTTMSATRCRSYGQRGFSSCRCCVPTDQKMSKRQSSTKDRTSAIQHPASSGEATLRVVFVGHVDHGKSTLIGRILSDTNSLPEGKLEQVQRACAAENMEFEIAFLLDALLEEQEQNITIDTTQIPFKTAKRNYMIIDAPGHKEFLKNMITGASNADAAVLVIAANEGVQEQSKRHAYLLSLLGVRQFCVVVNKMDLADYSEARFLEIEKKYREFLKTLNLETNVFIPASARFGENITVRSTKMQWHRGPTLAEALDAMTPLAPPTDLPLRLCVQDVYKFDDRRIIAGRIETGTLQVGDELVFSPANKTSIVQSIEHWQPASTAATSPRRNGGMAIAGDSIGITLQEQIFVERGYVASHSKDTPIETNRFHADLFWIARQPARLSHLYTARLATQEVKCQIVSLDEVMDSSSLERNPTKAEQLARNEVGRLTIQTRAPIVLDNHDRLPPLGRFVLADDGMICGGGIIHGGVYTDRSAIKSKNIFWSEGKITAQARATQHGHRGAVR